MKSENNSASNNTKENEEKKQNDDDNNNNKTIAPVFLFRCLHTVLLCASTDMWKAKTRCRSKEKKTRCQGTLYKHILRSPVNRWAFGFAYRRVSMPSEECMFGERREIEDVGHEFNIYTYIHLCETIKMIYVHLSLWAVLACMCLYVYVVVCTLHEHTPFISKIVLIAPLSCMCVLSRHRKFLHAQANTQQ